MSPSPTDHPQAHARGRSSDALRWLTEPGWLRVPAVIGVMFWLVKLLSTAMGEATSDYLVSRLGPVPAVLLGFVTFTAALVFQLARRRYRPVSYWLAIVMVGVFGTMGADVLHVGLGVPYVASTALFAVALVVIFVVWQRVEGTLSIHSIDTSRRELFYWATVIATFAMGTAVGDLAAVTANLGYRGSTVLFAGLILVPAIGYRWFRVPAVPAFWASYVLTRPLGASVADWWGKPVSDGGLGWGSGWVALGLTLAIAVAVAYLAATFDPDHDGVPSIRA